MKKILVILCVVVAVIVLVYGNVHWQRKIHTRIQVASEEYLKDVEKEKKEQQALIDSLNPDKNPHQSMLDYLHYKILTQDKVVISVLGSSVTAGAGASDPSLSWAALLEKKLQSFAPDFKYVKVLNRGFGGYSTRDLLKDKKIDLVVKDKPDLVIFETSILNNHGQSITMDETKENIKEIVTTIQKKLPGTKILIISPNPSTVKLKEVNSLGYKYLDYLQETKNYIEGNGWPYVDIYEGMEEKIKKENIQLKDILVDGVHPNDEGYRLWFEVLYDYMAKEH